MTRANLLKFVYFAGASKALRFYKKRNLTILNLHRITDERDYFFDPITPLNFEKLVKYVLKHYSVISFSELSEIKKPFNKPPLILSFDDGYYDFYEYALPILNKYDLPSNHNIVNDCAAKNEIIWTQRLNDIFNHCRNNDISLQFNEDKLAVGVNCNNKNWIEYYLLVFKYLLEQPKTERIKLISEKENELSISSKYRMMNWQEITECSKHKVEIGSHTYTHDVISTISNPQLLEHEILESKTEIEKQIGKPVDIIALPNGRGNKLVNDFVKRAGYKYLLYVNDTVNKIAEISDNDLNVFERIGIVQESYFEMILRTELFHAKLRSYV